MLAVAANLVAAALVVAGCAAPASEVPRSPSAAATMTVQSLDPAGPVDVPVGPKRVIVLDSTIGETLAALGVGPDVVVGTVKAQFDKLVPQYAADPVEDVAGAEWGTLNLEKVAALKPDLIITGGRFAAAGVTGIEKLDAPRIELTGQGHTVEDLHSTTQTLGRIFQKQDQAAALLAEFDGAVRSVRSAAKHAGSGIVLMTSGNSIWGTIGDHGSRHGLYYDGFGLQLNSKLADAVSGSGEHGADLSPEALRAANPDWLIVIDRNASVSSGDAVPAKKLLDNELINDTTAAKRGHIVYLNPIEAYMGEGLVTYLHAAQLIAQQLAA